MNEYEIRGLFGQLPEINFIAGYRYYLGNIDNYAKALLSILKSIKSKIPILKTMIESGEYEGLRTITQTLRRMMSTIGGETIADFAYEMESALLNNDSMLDDKLIEFVFTLEDLASRMEEVIKRLGVYSRDDKNRNASYFNYDFSRTKESIRLSTDFIDRKII